MKRINEKLKKYIEENILKEYDMNDKGHDIEHIKFVLNRAEELSENYELNHDMLYTIVCFHDIACHIDRENHEILSAKRLYEDKKIREFFTLEEIEIMKEAIEDHRASLEYVPRNIYGKILSSADRKIDVETYLKSSIGFDLKENKKLTEQELIERSYNFAIKKFGKNGYAVKKMYVKDKKYENFLKEIQYLIDNKKEFEKRDKENMKKNNLK